jgi:hypothetical protein
MMPASRAGRRARLRAPVALLLALALLAAAAAAAAAAAPDPAGASASAAYADDGEDDGGGDDGAPEGGPPKAGLPPPLVFLHIPKTAGTSLAIVMQGLLSELNCTRDPLTAALDPPGPAAPPGWPPPPPPPGARCVWAHAFPGRGRRDDRNFLARAAIGAPPPRPRSRAGGGAGAGATDSNSNARARPRPVSLDFLMGHLHYGSCPLLNAPRPGCAYTTVLREPLARVVSHYRWLSREAPAVLARRCPGCAAGGVDAFAQALANGSLAKLYLDNTETRMLAGDALWATVSRGRARDAAGAAGREMLERAKANLASREFALVGLTERLPEYVARLRLLLGLPPVVATAAAAADGAAGGSVAAAGAGGGAPPGVLVANAAPSPLAASQLAPATRRLLEGSQAADIELYAFAVGLVEGRYREGPVWGPAAAGGGAAAAGPGPDGAPGGGGGAAAAGAATAAGAPAAAAGATPAAAAALVPPLT